jgi:hypothetical protein
MTLHAFFTSCHTLLGMCRTVTFGLWKMGAYTHKHQAKWIMWSSATIASTHARIHLCVI